MAAESFGEQGSGCWRDGEGGGGGSAAYAVQEAESARAPAVGNRNPNGILRGIDGLRDYLMACCPPEAEPVSTAEKPTA